nr:Chain C, 12-mer peptide F12K [Toxoplasma gondii]
FVLELEPEWTVK